MICLDNVKSFFDNYPEFEKRKKEVLLRADEMNENGVIDETALPSVFGDLEMVFRYDMDTNIRQIRLFTAFLGKRQRVTQ